MQRLTWIVAIVLAGVMSAPASARSIPDPHQTPAPGNAGPEVPIDEADYRPAVNYQLQCAGCHLGSGRGFPAHGVPDMVGFVGNFLRVEGGREYLLLVPGVKQSALSAAQIAALYNWLLTESDIAGDSTPQDFVPYTATEVSRIVDERLPHVLQTRARLIQAMRDKGIAVNAGMPE